MDMKHIAVLKGKCDRSKKSANRAAIPAPLIMAVFKLLDRHKLALFHRYILNQDSNMK